MKKSPIRGVIAPNLTPFNDDLSVADDLFVDFARHLLATGCDGLAPFGTTGEATSLGLDERKRLLEKLLNAGIPANQIIAGTGVDALPDTVSLTKHAGTLGVERVMILPPHYYKGPDQQGLFAVYDYIIRQVADERMKITLYHIPQFSGVAFSADVVKRLAVAFPGTIDGIKDSSGDWGNTKSYFDAVPGFAVYPGAELALSDALALGGPGCISATANINGRAIHDVVMKYGQPGGEERQAGINKLRKIVAAYAPIPAIKGLLAEATGDRRWRNVRPPLTAAEPAASRKLAAILRDEAGFSLF